MAKKRKNYHRLFMFAVVILLILTVVIFNTFEGYWKVFTFLPMIVIIILGLWKNKKEEKEERNNSLRIRQYYQYPKK